MTLTLERPLPNWPRLMSVEQAADYLSIGRTTLAQQGPTPKRIGRRVLYDRTDLDRWVDRLSGQPLSGREMEQEAAEVERRFFEARASGQSRT